MNLKTEMLQKLGQRMNNDQCTVITKTDHGYNLYNRIHDQFVCFNYISQEICVFSHSDICIYKYVSLYKPME